MGREVNHILWELFDIINTVDTNPNNDLIYSPIDHYIVVGYLTKNSINYDNVKAIVNDDCSVHLTNEFLVVMIYDIDKYQCVEEIHYDILFVVGKITKINIDDTMEDINCVYNYDIFIEYYKTLFPVFCLCINPEMAQITGTIYYYYDNGQKMSSINYFNGVKNDQEVEWYPNGNVKFVKLWNNGCIYDKSIEYFEDGKLYKVKFYKDDISVFELQLNNNGNMISYDIVHPYVGEN